MHQLILSEENFSPSSYGGRLLRELQEKRGRPSVYRIYSGCHDGASVTFQTTSKDIHLTLGDWSRDALIWLAEVLDDECNPHGVREPARPNILFTLPGRDGRPRTVMVNCTWEEDGLVMNLSPART